MFSAPAAASSSTRPRPRYDAVVVGSGFGGAFCALELVRAGCRVVMVERGDWVARGRQSWEPGASVELTRHYTLESPYSVRGAGRREQAGLYSCVGGPSVFYGGVALRFREADFRPGPDIVDGSGARWPFGYDQLEPHYGRAEAILDVAGETGRDPTEPYRSSPFPQGPPPLAAVSRRLAAAARSLGLHPFHLPLAINYRPGSAAGRRTCIRCNTCDTFACALGAKNDLATTVLPDLIERGLVLRARTVAVQLEANGRRVTSLRCVERETGAALELRADLFVLAAGALASPVLLLASGLEQKSPAGDVVGRFLMRHRNAIVFGLLPEPADPVGEFHKQLGIHDYYFAEGIGSNEGGEEGRTKLGALQQVQTPPLELVKRYVPPPLDFLISPRTDHLAGLLVIAEDQPRARNRVRINASRTDRFGLPAAEIVHRYTRRDRRAGRVLIRRAKRILRRAGAMLFYVHHIRTFSHAVGTVRTGTEPSTSALNEWCRYRGLDNLYVVDASFMPTSAGLNPSLTIAANALRVGRRLADGEGWG